MKATKAVIRQRVEQVMVIRLAGAEFPDIRQYAAETDIETGRPWNVSDRQLWRYIEAADALLDEYLEKDRNKLFNRQIGQRRMLFARAIKAGDWRTALAIAKDESELFGLYPPKRIAPVNPDGDGPYDGGLGAILPELRTAVERLRQEAGRPAPGNGPCRSLGNTQNGPGKDHGGCRILSGPLASQPAPESVKEDVAPVFAPEWQEPDGGSPGFEDGATSP